MPRPAVQRSSRPQALVAGRVTGEAGGVRVQLLGWVDPESGETVRIRLQAGDALHGRLRRAGFEPVRSRALQGDTPLTGEAAGPARVLPAGTSG